MLAVLVLRVLILRVLALVKLAALVTSILVLCIGGTYSYIIEAQSRQFVETTKDQAAVLTLFGRYVGSVKEQGLRWNNPFYAAKKVSLRAQMQFSMIFQL